MVPIVINNFNRLSTTRKLVEDLIARGYNDIHILDNDSSYKPLLDWYSEIEMFGIKVFRIGHNSGQLALWNTGYINNFQNEPYIAYTDSDIQLNEYAPVGFIDMLIRIAHSYYWYHKTKIKVGLSLKVDDLPLTDLGNIIRGHEAQFWSNRLTDGEYPVYKADIDTTFAIIDPTLPFTYEALRVAGNLTAKHAPWYNDFDNLSEEELYIISCLDNKYSTYKGHYINWLENRNRAA